MTSTRGIRLSPTIMRVLVLHNRYSSRVPSGENVAVDDEILWLRQAGHDVEQIDAHNDDIIAAGPTRQLQLGAATIWSPAAQRRTHDTITRHRPDILHVHNLFPLLSASVLRAAHRHHIPVVWTVHNRRATCVIGTNHRAGHPCHSCRAGWRLPGIIHGCYGDSRPASLAVTAATSLFRGLARRQATPIAVSEHIRDWLVDSAGFAPHQVQVKHNGVTGPADTGTTRHNDPARHHTFLVAGYLTAYKGIDLILDAWQRAQKDHNLNTHDPTSDRRNAQLKIVGDGPLAEQARRAAHHDPTITWHPAVTPDAMASHYADSRAVVIPSTWDEPFGRSAAEALAHGRPAITTGTGGLAEIVGADSGWVTGTDPDTLATAIAHAARDDDAVRARGAAGTRRHHTKFSPAATTDALVAIYHHAREQAA